MANELRSQKCSILGTEALARRVGAFSRRARHAFAKACDQSWLTELDALGIAPVDCGHWNYGPYSIHCLKLAQCVCCDNRFSRRHPKNIGVVPSGPCIVSPVHIKCVLLLRRASCKSAKRCYGKRT